MLAGLRTITRLVVICAAVMIPAASAFAGDVSGIWTGQITDRTGDPQDLSFRFTQNGNALAGKMYGDNESTPILDPSLSGAGISFKVTTELNGAITTFLYTGTVTGDDMQLTRRRVDISAQQAASKPPAAKDAAANANPQRQPQTVHLKRLA